MNEWNNSYHMITIADEELRQCTASFDKGMGQLIIYIQYLFIHLYVCVYICIYMISIS